MICPNCGFDNKIDLGVCINCKLPFDRDVKLDNEVTILDSKTAESMDIVDDNIYFYKNFIIVAEINGFKVNFGRFDTFQEATKKRDSLVDDGWPIPEGLLDVGEEVSKNIFEKNGKFIVSKKIDGNPIVFGQYDTLDEANIAKFDFVKNNWSKSKFESEKNKTTTPEKFVYLNGKHFVVQRNIGENRIYGSFNILNDAVSVKRLLDSNGWDVSWINDEGNVFLIEDEYCVLFEKDYRIYLLGKFNSYDEADFAKANLIEDIISNLANKVSTTTSEKFVYRNSKKFIIQRNIGENRIYGSFNSFNDAVSVKRLLDSNGWDVSWINGEGNVFLIEDEYCVLFEKDYRIYLLGKYENYEDANENKFYLIENLNETHSFKESNIWHTRNGFEIRKRINGSIKLFGIYSTREEARIARDELAKNGWQKSFSEDSLLNGHISEDNDLWNEIIFSLSPLQKMVLDIINEFDENIFTLNDLKESKSNLVRFIPKNKLNSKLEKTLNELTSLNLIKQIDDYNFEKLGDYN